MIPARRAALMLSSTTILWGSTFFSMQLGIKAVETLGGSKLASPFLVTFLRFVVAIVLWLIVAPGSLKALGRRELTSSFIIAALGFVGIGLQGWGLGSGSSTVVAFMTNLTVIFTPIFAVLFFGERLRAGIIAGAVIALAGVFVLTNPTQGAFGGSEWLALGSAVIFGLQIQLVNGLTTGRDPKGLTLGMFLHFAWMDLAAVLLLPGGARLLSPSFLVKILSPIDGPTVLHRYGAAWSIPYLAIFGSVIAFFIWMRYQREILPSRAAIIYCCEPAFAAFFGWLFVGDALSWRLFVGGGLIIAANLACELMRGGGRSEERRGSEEKSAS